MCEFGISIVQEPQHVVYGHVTLSDIAEIAQAAARGVVVERLVIERPVSEPRKAAE
jgi:(2Fe-2S) ferredoxin